MIDEQFWHGKRVLLTGHTGFKGSWLSIWLSTLGAHVHGYALDTPTSPSLYTEARAMEQVNSELGDVCNAEGLAASIADFRPEIILHMAAQSLVRASYQDPVNTYSTNVMGTVHVLEAARQTPGVRAIVVVTTDKCYENREWEWGYREGEPMGGYDPYSNSKGCAELVTDAYRRSFFADTDTAVATARAGNVVGGGDWAKDRLIPDILRAFSEGQSAVVRNPHAIRPWQHVLEPLSAYLLLAQTLYKEGQGAARAFNFGPLDEGARPVSWIAERMSELWGDGASWELMKDSPQPHEATYLKLDISRARAYLQWSPTWTLQETLESIVNWQRAWLDGSSARQLCLNEIAHFHRSWQ